MLAVASSLAIALACAAQPSMAPLHVALEFSGGMTSIASLALAQTARVWAPYGVSVGGAGQRSADAVVVRVAIAERASTAMDDPRTLGSIVFHDGLPGREITLYAQRAWELICAVAGNDAEHWPRSYRELVMARVLGRALAHELGHFLLRRQAHSAAGLMRAFQSIADLMTVEGERLFLTPNDQKALADIRCAPPGE